MESKIAKFKLDQARMDAAGVEAIRRANTSDLIALLAHPMPSIAADYTAAIAAEIDQRIPVPDPRIGKLARPTSSDRHLRVVGVEPAGALRLRGDDWPRSHVDMRVDPDLIAPGDWLDG